MLARWVRTWDGRLLRPLLLVLQRRSVSPNTLTAAGLLLMVMSGVALSQRYNTAGIVLLLVGGGLDALDGELARLTNRASPLGALLDSVADHAGDGALHLGLLWSFLQEGNRAGSVFLFGSLFGSMLGSQIRARAAVAGVESKDIGTFTRCERLLVLTAGLISAELVPALWVLAVMNNLSAVQRLAHVVTRGSAVRRGSEQGRMSLSPGLEPVERQTGTLRDGACENGASSG